MFQVDDIGCQNYCSYTLPSRWKAPKLEDACYSTYIHLSSTQFFLTPGTNVYQMHQVYDHDTQGIDDSFWGQQAFLVFGARGRHYESAGRWKDMFSAVFDLFSGENNTYFEEFLRPTLGSSSNIDFFTERVSLHFGTIESPGRCHSHLAIPFAHGLWNGLTYSCTTRWTLLHTLGTCGAMVHQGGLRKGDEMNWGQSKNHVPNRNTV